MATVVKPTGPLRQIGAPPMVPRIAPREDLNPFRIAQIQFDIAAIYVPTGPDSDEAAEAPGAKAAETSPASAAPARRAAVPANSAPNSNAMAPQAVPPGVRIAQSQQPNPALRGR